MTGRSLTAEAAVERILQEIEHALKVRLYHLAMALTLSLPEICASLESPSGVCGPERYREWYRDNMAAAFPWLTPNDCYRLHCGVVHHGHFGYPQNPYSRVIFVLPGNGMHLVNHVRHDAYFADLLQFCLDAVQCARRWLEAKQDDETVQKNATHLLQVRPRGMPPYGEELAVIT
jgi:hypothetical protein